MKQKNFKMADVSYKRFFVRQILYRPNRLFILFFLVFLAILCFTKNIFTVLEPCKMPACRCKNEVKREIFDEVDEDLYEKKSEPAVSAKIHSFLFVAILTGPTNTERRTAMRETWLSNLGDLQEKVILRFVIGTANLTSQVILTLGHENDIYGDLLLLSDFQDAYKKLTLKVLKTFSWISEHVNTKFIFKGDDDTFARLNVIVSELKTKEPSRLYWGFIRGDSRVKRAGPWAENSWKLCDHYLPYAMGGGYVLSQDLVEYIANNGHLLQMFNNEDVSVGAWLAPLQVNRIHDPRFDTEYKSRGCNNLHIVSHKQSMPDMYTKQIHLRTTKKLCAKEVEERQSFIYDWNVQPSKCCKRKRGIP